ncbi:hypothetical protein PMIT1342_00948 [Prochlorococcus marinus str. MIT 1342]|nr:hypothetical protein PMIT1342_00948 [Prochlorococcus marinus str. MIT 1342]
MVYLPFPTTAPSNERTEELGSSIYVSNTRKVKTRKTNQRVKEDALIAGISQPHEAAQGNFITGLRLSIFIHSLT